MTSLKSAIREVFDWADGDCELDIVDATPATASAAPVSAAADVCNYDLIAEFDAMIAADEAPKYAPVSATPAAVEPEAAAPVIAAASSSGRQTPAQ